MLFFKTKDDQPLALATISDTDAANAGLTKITKDEYLKLTPTVEEDEVVEVEGVMPPELQYLNDQGGVAKALYNIAKELGLAK